MNEPTAGRSHRLTSFGKAEREVTLIAAGKSLELLRQYEDDLRYIFIVSQVELVESGDSDVSITISAADGHKCERCWNYSVEVGKSPKYPTVCERCVEALEEIESDGRTE